MRVHAILSYNAVYELAHYFSTGYHVAACAGNQFFSRLAATARTYDV